jgi:DNA-binding LytR/AlgR family response regulator
MNPIKCIIIDDEPLARELLTSYINKVPYLHLTGSYENAIEAFGILKQSVVDLIFLDIEMPGMTGLELLRSLIHKPSVIVVSAYSEYALEGFNLDVTDYLLKPVLFERFMKAIGKINIEPIDFKIENTKNSISEPYLFFRVNKENVKVYLKDILWIESLKDYIKVKTIFKELVTYQRISLIEQKLPQSLFLRIHRSFIIAKDKVTATNNSHIKINAFQIPIGKSYKQEVYKHLKS